MQNLELFTRWFNDLLLFMVQDSEVAITIRNYQLSNEVNKLQFRTQQNICWKSELITRLT